MPQETDDLQWARIEMTYDLAIARAHKEIRKPGSHMQRVLIGLLDEAHRTCDTYKSYGPGGLAEFRLKITKAINSLLDLNQTPASAT